MKHGAWPALSGFGRLFAVLLLGLGLHLPAQASLALWTTHCNVCHGTPPAGARVNAADAPSVIDAAITNVPTMGGLSGLSAGDRSSIATYIGTQLSTAAGPINTAFQTASAPLSLAAVVALQTAATNLTLQTVTPPAKGSVAYNNAAETVTYTPSACQTGPDSFSYRAANGGTATSTRTISVSIGTPTAPVINSAATANGQTGVAFSYSITVASCSNLVSNYNATGLPPGLLVNPSTGVISGTPTAVGVFNATIEATNAGGTDSNPLTITITLGPPVVTSAGTASGAVGIVFPGYQITATNSPTSFGATGLPPGLTVDPLTGAITGTPTVNGTFNATVSATNATATGNKAVVFTIAVGVPAITSAATVAGQTGVPFSYQITATNGPTSYGLTGTLPAGLVFNAGAGTITGTPTVVGGPTSVTLTATNGTGTSAPFNLDITIGLGPPVITSAASASAGEAIAFNYQITATNPPHTSFNAVGLPAGLAIDTGTGAISGTPASGTAGAHPVTISATNATGTGSTTLTINVSQFAPVVNSPGTAAGQTGVAFTYQITAANGPTSFGATGLPPGLAVNTGTGLISGVPTTVGTFNGTVSAANGTGSSTIAVVFTISIGPPVVTSGATASGAAGFAFSYQITATNSPTSFGASGLPPGVTIDTATGLVSGTPTVNGTFNATVSATNATATGTLAVTITIAVGLPVIDSPTVARGMTGVAFRYQVTATNGPTSFTASGLPAGLAIDGATGLISGVPATPGTSNVNLAATNGTGTGSRALSIVIELSPPQVTSANTASGRVGDPFSYTIEAVNGPASFGASGLPPGLTVDSTTGVISGVPTTGGTFTVTLSVVNASGTATRTLTITIAFLLPTAGDLALEVPYEEARAITLPVSGFVTQVNIVTLPDHGLVTVTPGSATVTYTPALGFTGEDSFTYTVTNPAGTTAPATVRITIKPVQPTATAVTMTVALNTPLTLDLRTRVKGSGLTGVSIAQPPAHGTAAVNGLLVTYTPRTDFFGADSFTYVVFGSGGVSAPATITVNVVGRPDPTADPNVRGLVDAQAQAARRFATAQIGNYQRRMEALHQAPAPAPQAQKAPATMVASLAAAATSGTVDAASLAPGNGASTLAHGLGVWIGGTGQFGRRDESGERSGLRFSTDGISVGIDRRFGERLALGLGVGYARDETQVGSQSRSKARGGSFAFYGSFQPGAGAFVDAMLGYGRLELDSDRFVAAAGDFAVAERKGRQLFGSIAAGYEHRREGVLLSPYGRLDFSADRLDSASESGAGLYALTYHEQRLRSSRLALGVRAEAQHDTEFGWAVPRVRAEYRRELQDERAAGLSYADLFTGPEYFLTPAGTSRNALLLGLGADLVFRGGLRIALDYEAQRSSGASNVQGLRLMVSQELDGKGFGAWRWDPKMFHDPVTVDFGVSYDDNVTRGRDSEEQRADQIYSLTASQTRPFTLNANTRLLVTGLASGEKFRRHAGLGRFSLAAQAELQYRASGSFDAPTYAIVGRAAYEQYESRLRTGARYFAGVNVRRAITDRIEAFAEIGTHARYGRSDVFNTREHAAKVNLDYSLGPRGVVYATGEYRRGDLNSTGVSSLFNVGIADVFAPDDAFEGEGLFAYRVEGRTLLGTLGWNYPLGPRDSLDLSWRRVQARPTRRPAFDLPWSPRYDDNQYSIVYLMRF